jgi:hypothetical protein
MMYSEESTRLTYTGLLVELEHLKIKTTLIDEMFASVMGEYVCVLENWWILQGTLFACPTPFFILL